VDGAREVVLPETGVLLRPRDLPGLTRAILRLAGDPGLRQAMGQEGRRRFAHQFRHETMTSQLRALYERLLAARGEGEIHRGARRERREKERE
jgi:glycosyltransferase involved in cell wall biosynthesis